ncbi:hypothetical protein Sipo8835_33600 [Streptomyces ipomoeae]|uniref:Lipoprotein n=2 Tax=Streptomyces ipomoeae TaxID=103232 RepID=L1L4V6_9ACTN|nr:hypothetical protein [Streptomyces ipomoeae]EKX68101.1 hypothetical protein STRIP9103_09495 [Streptomyces ipomoeae 91-03]MDX2699850.1 hypothetical protein [Streptomyces ipomoeae]MDX2819739.1 hypothetical protein [Streptomyces ipomoeae]MDX2845751.1 hypothetical protein [Streptomyces ipomoeae]MDX2874709.1 hypothetical protein [Streptomyces ipomoeae]
MRNRIITAAAIATAASVALLGGTGQAFADSQAAAKPAAPAKLTVAAYKTWLKKTPGEEAKDTLHAFNKLPAAKQKKFVGYLQDPKVLKAFVVAHQGKIPSLSYGTTVTYKKDITFTTRTSAAAPGIKDRKTITLTTRSIERIFNIPVTELSTVLTYETKGNQITGRGWKTKNYGSNYNAAFAIKSSKTRTALKANELSGVTNWTATPKYKSAGTAVIKKHQVVTGKGARTHHAEIGNGSR